MRTGSGAGAGALVVMVAIGALALAQGACGSSSSSSPDDAGSDTPLDVTPSDASDAAPVDASAVDGDGSAPDAPSDAPADAPADGDARASDAGVPLIAKAYGDGSLADATSIAVDATGNVVVVGYFQGTLDFGLGTLTAAGSSNDIFVAKLDPMGRALWAKRFGDNQSQIAYGVAVDATGNVYVTGYNSGTLDFGVGAPLVSAGLEDVFAAKLDATTGAAVWAQGWGDANDQAGYAIGIDKVGGVVVTGYMKGTVNFGLGPLVSAGGADAFLVKLTGAGAVQWSKRYGDANDQYAAAVAFDVSNDVFVTGEFQGTVDFGLGALVSAGMYDVFLVKLDPTGATTLLAKRWGGANQDLGDSMAVDTDGSIYLAGGFQGSIDFGTGAIAATGTGAKFLAKLDATGAGRWSKSLGVSGVFDVAAVTIDRTGNAVITGGFQTQIDFGAGSVSSAGGLDVFLAKYTTAGVLVWGRTFGDAADQFARAVATDATGDIAVCGSFLGSIDFGAGPLTSTGTGIYVAELRP